MSFFMCYYVLVGWTTHWQKNTYARQIGSFTQLWGKQQWQQKELSNHRLASSKWPNLGQSPNMEGTYISLEPKLPLVWMEKAFFWRVQAPKIEDKQSYLPNRKVVFQPPICRGYVNLTKKLTGNRHHHHPGIPKIPFNLEVVEPGTDTVFW